MLKDLRGVAERIGIVVNDESLSETRLPRGLRRKIEHIVRDMDLNIYAHTSSAKRSSGQYALFPNQHFRFAVAVYDLAFELIKYIDCIDVIRREGNLGRFASDNVEVIIEGLAQVIEFRERLNEDDIRLLANFIRFPTPAKDKVKKVNNDEYRLGGKSIINQPRAGVIEVRNAGDCFGSVILTRLNMPNSSSSIFGDVVYSLTREKAVYDELNSYYEALEKGGGLSEKIPDLGHPLPKPFLLLAGISGTGKSRFVRQQAERNPSAQQKIISVRPDWHEPSDLLGYVSRLAAGGDQYIVTDALRFMFSAWQAAFDAVEFLAEGIKGERSELGRIPPFWLGLDEMNLAPVEQYFADYLSVIESRKWEWVGNDFTYTCGPLLSAEHCQLIKDETLRDSINDELWVFFEKYGMPVPFNLIVAGTVNMDETTHGFSRKVIDRALTFDFGEFAPNTFDDYFEEKVEPRVFSYPTLSVVKQNDFVGTADEEGKKSIAFLNKINEVLKDTPFELAYRALNELLISVVCEKPKTDEELQAVWDDFLMTKVLPRIEGDADKLQKVFLKAPKDDEPNLLGEPKLLKVVTEQLTITQRKDLFLQSKGGGDKDPIALRSPTKIKQMVERLDSAGFTSFWP